jgi:hypothetical protein
MASNREDKSDELVIFDDKLSADPLRDGADLSSAK